MKARLLQTLTNLLLMIVCLLLIVVYLLRPSLSLPETSGSAEPAQLNKNIVPASSPGLIGPAAPPAAADVVPFVQTLHIHGVPYEQARQFGPEAVPLLLDLLADPANEVYATNIVVTLGFIGHPSARQPLLDYLTQTQGEVSLDRFRGLTSVPYALSQLAHQGDVASLDFLLQASDPNYWNAQTLPWTFNGLSPNLELYHQTLLALGVSGLPQALTRLEQITNQGGLSAQADNEVLQQALELNQRVQQEGMAPVVNPDPNPLVVSGDIQDTLVPQVIDTNVNGHLHLFTITRYVTMSTPNEVAVDQLLIEGSEIVRTADSPADISCCVSLQRSGAVGTFAVTDGTIATPSELNAVFGVTSHGVKVVVSLDFCGGFNTSIIGCAAIGSPTNLVLEHLGSVTLNGILWAHEFGHNQGLFHPNPSVSTRIMNGSLSSVSKQMTQAECNAWHSTPANPGTITGPITGSCPLLFTATKILEPTSVVTSGATITYTITIVNNTVNPVTNLTVSDNLPAELTYVPGSATANPPIINLTNFPNTTAPFTLNGNSSVQITYKAQVGSVNSHEILVNTATINALGLPQSIQASNTAIVDPLKTYLPVILLNN